MLIDTHCHLNHAKLADEIPLCLERSLAAGVTQMIVVGYDWESSQSAIRIAERYAGVVWAAIGVHPHDAKDWSAEIESGLRDAAQRSCVVAIGEIGLDFHYDFSPRDAQESAFRAQMRLAEETQLPVILHCREAYPEVLQVLEEAPLALGGVMHCWAGSVEEARRTVSLGYALGFGGTLTFKNAQNVRDSAVAVPQESLLVETDAPYLAPAPHRGHRNEPAYVRFVAEKLAELRGLDFESLATLTTQNAFRLFPRIGSAC